MKKWFALGLVCVMLLAAGAAGAIIEITNNDAPTTTEITTGVTVTDPINIEVDWTNELAVTYTWETNQWTPTVDTTASAGNTTKDKVKFTFTNNGGLDRKVAASFTATADLGTTYGLEVTSTPIAMPGTANCASGSNELTYEITLAAKAGETADADTIKEQPATIVLGDHTVTIE